MLYSKQVQISSRNKNGQTPLHTVGNLGDEDAFFALIKAGADVNALDNEKKNAEKNLS